MLQTTFILHQYIYELSMYLTNLLVEETKNNKKNASWYMKYNISLDQTQFRILKLASVKCYIQKGKLIQIYAFKKALIFFSFSLQQVADSHLIRQTTGAYRGWQEGRRDEVCQRILLLLVQSGSRQDPALFLSPFRHYMPSHPCSKE